MNCSKIQSLLSAYADRELTGVEMFLVRQHVHECDACRLEESEVRRVKSVLSSAPMMEPSPDFEARLVAAVMGAKAEPAEERRVKSATGFALTTLAAAATICGIYIARGVPESRVAGPIAPVSNAKGATKTAPNMAVTMRRDSAFINSSDPLSGPRGAIAASYAAP